MFFFAVTLIVKSCNQQFEDQEVRCELNWTIGKVKQTLTEVYPSKPVSLGVFLGSTLERPFPLRTP